MEKDGTTHQPWENESESRISCFSIYRVFKEKRKEVFLPLEWKRISQSNFQGSLTKRILKTHAFLVHSTL